MKKFFRHIINKFIACAGILLLIGLLGNTLMAAQGDHPRLILTKQGVANIKANLGNIPLFDASLKSVRQEVDLEMASGIEVPVPKDLAGGYTHERHKKNFFMLQQAGVLFQITGEQKYAVYVRDALLKYAKLYPTLKLHPTNRSYATGKLFWQCLNDANWLVYTSQAYDCIYDWLSPAERNLLEKDLFRPYADFLSIESPQFFNRIHNHSTWGNAAVGMIGLVMNDEVLIDRALYGIGNDAIDPDRKDNDGGFIKRPGQTRSGFFANLESPFSPDGYYTEGPYYQRYAMYPFMLFAEAIENVRPDIKIFAYKDSVLIKAVHTLLNLTDQNGEFFPLNDAQKGMSYLSRELVSAVNIAYHFGGNNPALLSIARQQGQVLLDDTGLSVARDLHSGKARPFVKRSIQLRDGSAGRQGGIGILRAGTAGDELSLVMKYTAQGLSHGHFDKLSFSLYNNGREVIQDYGLARFVNIEQKNGGGYLKENTTWAKQSVAHNTLVVNKTSHFEGDFEKGNAHHSDSYFFETGEKIQIVSAKDRHAYPGVLLHRTMAVMIDEDFANPLIIDIFRVNANREQQYDLPYYFGGQLMSTNVDYAIPKALEALGEGHGYQHLWKEAEGTIGNDHVALTWLLNDKFYSFTAAATPGDQLLFVRTGANDPEFNLRRDGGIILRKSNVKNTAFVSIIEAHGHYDPVSEIAEDAFSNIASVSLLHSDNAYTAIGFSHINGGEWVLCLANENAAKEASHQLAIKNQQYNWIGPFQLFKNHNHN
ncbi:alginate lyase family protein [Fulvivirgaceae bacterium BMA12]|uniref:Alginate lyase family protein n=1 Tax=Agaribacillus aureus TaxID=3051825 RepID=A0ABT8LB65_9BACT|nr:alginate lyase family protein [Fulvivirgaceae bacterium BMA12]